MRLGPRSPVPLRYGRFQEHFRPVSWGNRLAADGAKLDIGQDLLGQSFQMLHVIKYRVQHHHLGASLEELG